MLQYSPRPRPELTSAQIVEASSKLKKAGHVKVPFPEPKPAADSNLKVSFDKPSQFNVVGSYVSKTMIRSQKDHAVDMVVVMPESTLQRKDFLDLRYFYKRAYFLAVIASGLESDLGESAEIVFEYLGGNLLLPILSIKPTPTDTEDTHQGSQLTPRIRIIPCAPNGFFPSQKLQPGAALIRKEANDDGSPIAATPFYNSTLKAEGCYLLYLRLIRQAEKSCPAFKDACILGRIFLQQRGVSERGGFGHFEWAVLLALLLQGGGGKKQPSLSPALTSSQLFKAVIRFLSATNFAKKPFVLGADKPETEEFHEPGPVLYDSARQLNIAYKMSSASAALLQHQAKWTNTLLGNKNIDPFTPVFITKADVPLQAFDMVVLLSPGELVGKYASTDRRGRTREFANKVYTVLKRALDDRARLVHVKVPGPESWSLKDSPASEGMGALEVGILFDPANISRQVDHGPSSEEKEESKKFRQFWGEKAELRRFADGAIHETLIWTSTSPEDLCEEIVRYSLRLHCHLGHLEDEITFHGSGFSSLIPIQPTDALAFNAARKAFSSFERDIRDLEDLPLLVRQMAPISPDLRHASVKAPLGATKSGPRPMDVVLFFEGSGKWPESLAAVQRTKVAFLLKIGDLLESKKSGIKTHLGLEGADSEIENLAFLDVVYDSGYAFRLRVHSDLEGSLLERRTKDKSLDQRIRTESAVLQATFKRLYVHLPLLGQTISTYAMRFPALSPTIRLLKDWFSAHKLTCHFTEEFIELVALYVFVSNSSPWSTPSSASTGFLRALLFLAHWDWRSEALIVDANDDLSAEDRAELRTRLAAWRKIDPHMNHTVLFVATTTTGGTEYTTSRGEAKPSKVVATRMTTLARSATKLVKERGVELEPKALFVPSLKDYDILIHLSPKVTRSVSRVYATDDADGDARTRHSRFKNLDERTAQDPLPLVQHPVEALLHQLDAAYSGSIMFFHGAAEDAVIAGIWNPHMARRSFKVNLPSSYRPMELPTQQSDDSAEEEEEELVEINREAILAEIARIGGDLVDRIDTKDA